MNSLLDEVDGFDYPDDSLLTTGSSATSTPINPANPAASNLFTSTQLPGMNLPFATTSPMGVVLDNILFQQQPQQQSQPQSQPIYDWAAQPTATTTFDSATLFGTAGLNDITGAATAATIAAPGVLPPMPAMPTTVVSNEEIESQIIHDSQGSSAATAAAEGTETVAPAVEGEGESDEMAMTMEQQQQQQQEKTKVKLAELARANVGTNYGMPPFASFVRDVKNERFLGVKKRYMTRDDINEMIDTHYKMLNSWTPYAEDFYRLNYFHSIKKLYM